MFFPSSSSDLRSHTCGLSCEDEYSFTRVCVPSLCQGVSPTLKDVFVKARQNKRKKTFSLSVLQVILNLTSTGRMCMTTPLSSCFARGGGIRCHANLPGSPSRSARVEPASHGRARRSPWRPRGREHTGKTKLPSSSLGRLCFSRSLFHGAEKLVLRVWCGAEMLLHGCGPLGILRRSHLIKSNLQSFRRFLFKENALKGIQQRHAGRCSLWKLKKRGCNFRCGGADRLSALSAGERGAPSPRSSLSC